MYLKSESLHLLMSNRQWTMVLRLHSVLLVTFWRMTVVCCCHSAICNQCWTVFFADRYVSRVNYLDSSKHTILGTQQFRPKEFSTQIALNMDNAWGVLRCIIDTCMKLPDGKYLILKDPLKVSLLSDSAPWITSREPKFHKAGCL